MGHITNPCDILSHCQADCQKPYFILFVIPMITANASTAADDLGVAVSGDVAIERALDNNAKPQLRQLSLQPTGIFL
jgi:hypothetical protein